MDVTQRIAERKRLELLRRIAERDAGVPELEATGVLAEEVLSLRTAVADLGRMLSTIARQLERLLRVADQPDQSRPNNAGKPGAAQGDPAAPRSQRRKRRGGSA